LQTISDDPKTCSAMILCHTRELAYQIKNEIIRFTKFMKNIRTEVVYGGEPMDGQIKMFKGLNAPHIVVGTPGRILALTKGNHIPMSNLKVFVLDECDKLLDQIGKFPPPSNCVCRHETRHSGDLQRDAPQQAGDDVHGDPVERHQRYLPQIYAQPHGGAHRKRVEVDPARPEVILRRAEGQREDQEAD
jgi:hypothetical protein